MKKSNVLTVVLALTALASTASVAFADEGAVKEDTAKIQAARQELQKDRKELRELKRHRRQELHRMRQERRAQRHAEKGDAPAAVSPDAKH
jgi:ABC-type siderophore export system fused ATPase/permease subunit